jgi:ribose/xylose/arabinose/galactoside ABC-type transport system permease subunit
LVGAIWFDGMLITRAKLPAFIATKHMTIARGLANITDVAKSWLS